MDIKSLLDDAGLQFTARGNNAILNSCPTCDGSDKLWIDLKKIKWVCFSCENKGAEYSSGGSYLLLTHVLGFSKRDAMQTISSGESVQYSDQMSFGEIGVNLEPEEEEKKYSIPSWFVSLVALPLTQSQYVENYLKSRHITEIYQKNRFSWMYDSNSYRLAVIIYDETGKAVGHQGRDLTGNGGEKFPKCQDRECKSFRKYLFWEQLGNCKSCGLPTELTLYPKTLSSYGLSRSNVLFGEDTIQWNHPVTIVEGPFDAANTPNSLATLGKSVSEEQISKIISKNPVEIIIYFDGDDPGYKGAVDLYRDLSPFVRLVSLVPTEKGSDPGSLTYNQNLCLITEQRTDFQTWCDKIPIPVFSMI